MAVTKTSQGSATDPRDQMAKLLLLTTRQLDEMIRDNRLPPPKEGRYNPMAMVHARIADLEAQRNNPTGTSEELATWMDLSQPGVVKLTKEGKIPRVRRGLYEFRPAIIGYINDLRRRARGDAPTDIGEEALRLKREQRLMAEMERQKMSRNLVPAAEAEQGWVILASMAANALDALAARIADQVDPDHRETLMNEAVRARQAIADELKRLAAALS